MFKILIATHNPAKLKDMEIGLADLAVETVSLTDLRIDDEPVENGETFMENARIKARYYGNKTGLPTLSDDGGLIIEALGGEPGINTKMWLGRNATDKELIDYTLQRLQGIANRKAYFEICLFFYDPQTSIEINEVGTIRGRLAKKPHSKIVHGYPYRSVFIVNELNKYYLELTDEEHQKINHRLKALKRLSQKITTHLLK